MIRSIAAFILAGAIVGLACNPAAAGIKLATLVPAPMPEYKPEPKVYDLLATPICATADELAAWFARWGFASDPKRGLSEPGRDADLVVFAQKWSDAEYAALAQGNRKRACIVAVGKGW